MTIEDFVNILISLSVFAESRLTYMKDSGYLNVDDVSDKYYAEKGTIKRVSFGVDIYTLGNRNNNNNDFSIEDFSNFIENRKQILLDQIKEK